MLSPCCSRSTRYGLVVEILTGIRASRSADYRASSCCCAGISQNDFADHAPCSSSGGTRRGLCRCCGFIDMRNTVAVFGMRTFRRNGHGNNNTALASKRSMQRITGRQAFTVLRNIIAFKTQHSIGLSATRNGTERPHGHSATCDEDVPSAPVSVCHTPINCRRRRPS